MGTKGKYERDLFQGNNKFWLNGKLMTGPDYWNAFLVLIATLVAAGLYFPGTYLWLAPTHPGVGYPLLVLGLALVGASVTLLLLAYTSDPGIIPRGDDSYQRDDLIINRELMINGRCIRMKYCETCRIWRPPRASHCSICNNCVERFDHHCPYLSNCVGRRNYRLYFWYVFVTATLCLFVFSTSVMSITWKTIAFAIERDLSGGPAIKAALDDGAMWMLWPVIILCVPAFIFTGFLTGLHLTLMYWNMTTAEKFKKTFSVERGNPYVPKGFANIGNNLFSKKPSSKIKAGYTGPKWSFPENCEILENGRVLQSCENVPGSAAREEEENV